MKFSRNIISVVCMVFLLVLLEGKRSFAQGPITKPNIVVFFADDLGYGDLGAYGHPTILTPNLDRMASEGMKFTQFYVGAPVCTQSRAALLTGRLSIRTGIYGKRDVFFPNSTSGLSLKEVTIPEILKTVGYQTGIIGKWHLGSISKYLPTKQGFDYWFGIPYSNDMGRVGITGKKENGHLTGFGIRKEYVPTPLYRNDSIIEEEPNQHFLTQRYTQESIDFIERSAKSGKPFFLYYASNFPHIPLYASPDFEGKSKRGIYGDVVQELDWSYGQILKKLKELNIDKNTLVIFTSDNGPWLLMGEEGGSAGLLYEGKNSTYEGGMREPAIAWWPGTIEAGSVNDNLMNALDLLPTFASLTGAHLPDGIILDGVDASKMLHNSQEKVRDVIYYYFNQHLYAVRKGAWKAHFITHLSYSPEPPVKHEIPLLYNLDEDPSEKNNLADSNPKKIEELRKLFNEMNQIVPEPGRIDIIDSLQSSH